MITKENEEEIEEVRGPKDTGWVNVSLVDAIKILPDGREEPTSIEWTWFRCDDSSKGTVDQDWPVDADPGSNSTFGDNECQFCNVWRSQTSICAYVEVVLDYKSVYYHCPSLRSAMAIVREFLPVIEFDIRFQILTLIYDHIRGICNTARPTRRGVTPCAICKMINELGR